MADSGKITVRGVSGFHPPAFADRNAGAYVRHVLLRGAAWVPCHQQ